MDIDNWLFRGYHKYSDAIDLFYCIFSVAVFIYGYLTDSTKLMLLGILVAISFHFGRG